jgi:hypothetical protein
VKGEKDKRRKTKGHETVKKNKIKKYKEEN